jgi:hypothetical protein
MDVIVFPGQQQYTCLTSTGFWDQTWWIPEEVSRRFGGSHYLHLQGRTVCKQAASFLRVDVTVKVRRFSPESAFMILRHHSGRVV